MNKQLVDTIKKDYPNVKIVMASKYLEDKASFMPFVEAGQLDFGENRVEALETKREWLKDYPITWHYIGTLQTKKVKQIINAIDILHSLDRLKLAKEIEKRREGILPCFVQVNISDESQKHGFDLETVEAFLESIKDFEHITVIGLMGMASDTNDEALIRKQLTSLKTLRDQLQKQYPSIKELSMGMTQDYHIALDVGTTVLRLGRILLTEGL